MGAERQRPAYLADTRVQNTPFAFTAATGWRWCLLSKDAALLARIVVQRHHIHQDE